jgi:hypothetical protein
MVRLTGYITCGMWRAVKKCMYNFRWETSKEESIYEIDVDGSIILKIHERDWSNG